MDAVEEEHPGREIAGALARYWAGGSGPSHASLASALALAGYDETQADSLNNKEQRVLLAVRQADADTAKLIVEELLNTLRSAGEFDSSDADPRAQTLSRAFARRGFELTPEGFPSWGPAAPEQLESPTAQSSTTSDRHDGLVELESTIPSVELLLSSLRRLPLALRPLVVRRRGRAGFTVADEYDLQDAVEALLRSLYNDVRPEERTPSYAGSSSVMDFLLRDERVAIEVKVTSAGRGEHRLKQELLIDIADYQQHPRVQHLIVVAYDLVASFSNPRGFENDLSGRHNDLVVDVIVVGWPLPPLPPTE